MVWILMLTVATALGVYRATHQANKSQQSVLAAKAFLYSIPAIFSILYLLQWTAFPRIFTILFFIFIPVCFSLGRMILNRMNSFMQRKGYGKHNTLIFGYENGGAEILSRFTSFPELGYEIKGIITKQGQITKHLPRKSMVYPRIPLSDLRILAKEQLIDQILIPSTKFATNGSSVLLDVARENRIAIKLLSPEADRLLSTSRIYDIAGLSLYIPPRHRIDSFKRGLKRLFDLSVGIFALLLLSPIYIVTAIAIYLESGRPIIFKQRRAMIQGGKTFDFYKFRSMVKNADELKAGLLNRNESDGALFKIKNDPRMTKVGRFIRRYSIDELPQLFNVLKGDMSLVGPRPLPLSDFAKVNEGPDFWEAMKIRDTAKPGMSGLWQISGRSHVKFNEMVLLDSYYIENQSVMFDIEILFATVLVVLFGKGGY
jgi:exopolysaccharide biosynthesis polyprenyl glycosylphosphotransferase